MNKNLFTLGMVLYFFTLSPVVSEGKGKGPKIQFDVVEQNWGTIYDGEKATHVFNFTNVGDEDLVIDKVNSSCGCTAALVSEKLIPPGGKGEIKATFDSSGRPGQQTKTITITSNDPVEPSTKVTITGNVEKYLEIKPDPLNFGTVFRGEPAMQILRIVPPKIHPDLKITKVESNQKYVVATLGNSGNWGVRMLEKARLLFKKRSTEEKEEERGIPVSVSLDPTAPVGPIRANLRFETDDERKPNFNVSVTGLITGPIQIVPSALTFSSRKDAEVLVRKVTLTSKGRGFKIQNVENNSPHLAIETLEKESGKSYEIEVKLSPDAPKGQFRENLVIHTNNKEQPEITIPIYGFIQ